MRTMTGYMTTILLSFLIFGSTVCVLFSTGTNDVEAQVMLPEPVIEIDPWNVMVVLPPEGTGNSSFNITVRNQDMNMFTVKMSIDIPGYQASPENLTVTLMSGCETIKSINISALTDNPYTVYGTVRGEVLVNSGPFHVPIVTEANFMVSTPSFHGVELTGIYNLSDRYELSIANDPADTSDSDAATQQTNTYDNADTWIHIDTEDLTGFDNHLSSGNGMIMAPGKTYTLGFAVTNLGNRRDHLNIDIINMKKLSDLGFSWEFSISKIDLKPLQSGVMILRLKTPEHQKMDRNYPVELRFYSGDPEFGLLDHTMEVMVTGEDSDENVVSILQVIIIALGAFLVTYRRK